MNDDQYRTYALTLLDRFAGFLEDNCEGLSETDPLRELAARFRALASDENLYESGQELVQRLFASCPDFAPSFPRDLLWFLGGDCLHFMPDEEIEGYQRLEECRLEAAARGELMNYPKERAKFLKLQ